MTSAGLRPYGLVGLRRRRRGAGPNLIFDLLKLALGPASWPFWGLVALTLSVLAPILPLPSWAAGAPLPLAGVWAAFGWAGRRELRWTTPALLAGFGAVHDYTAGQPLGLYVGLYLGAFLLGRLTTGPGMAQLAPVRWLAFAGTCAALVGAAVIGLLALGVELGAVRPLAEAMAVTALTRPLVAGLYAESEARRQGASVGGAARASLFTDVLAALVSRRSWPAWGFGLALLSVLLPALPHAPLLAQPPLPLAVLWAAYGWASASTPSWKAPAALAGFGLIHDHLAHQPYGVFVVLYLTAYLISRAAAKAMSAPRWVARWGGFVVTCAVLVGLVAVVGPLAAGGALTVAPFALACAVTAAAYLPVRHLYETEGGAR